MKQDPVTLPMLRAACALAGPRLPFEGKSFKAVRNGKPIFIRLQVVQGLERRGLVTIQGRTTGPARRRRFNVLGAKLTGAGWRLVKANPPLCIGCGCTDARACPEGCFWVAPGWCSSCDQQAVNNGR